MAEGFEKTAFQEGMNESLVGKAIRSRVEEMEKRKQDYWEIKQDIQDRKAVHGGGVYKHYVENMDKVIHFMYAGKELGLLGKVMETSKKVRTRVDAAVTSFGASVIDIPVNILTWLPRKLSPLAPPKDIFKRMALARADLKISLAAAKAGMVRTELGVVGGIRKGTEAVLNAPEVFIRTRKRRVERFVNWIKSPFTEQKPVMPKAKS